MGSVKWDDRALRKAVGAAAEAQVTQQTSSIAERANAMSADFRTGILHKDGKRIGNTQPEYGSDVQRYGDLPVGIVYTGNYAAMRDNHENNTLLKAKG